MGNDGSGGAGVSACQIKALVNRAGSARRRTRHESGDCSRPVTSVPTDVKLRRRFSDRRQSTPKCRAPTCGASSIRRLPFGHTPTGGPRRLDPPYIFVRDFLAFIRGTSRMIRDTMRTFSPFIQILTCKRLRPHRLAAERTGAASKGLIRGSGRVLSCTRASCRPTKNVRLPATSRL